MTLSFFLIICDVRLQWGTLVTRHLSWCTNLDLTHVLFSVWDNKVFNKDLRTTWQVVSSRSRKLTECFTWVNDTTSRNEYWDIVRYFFVTTKYSINIWTFKKIENFTLSNFLHFWKNPINQCILKIHIFFSRIIFLQSVKLHTRFLYLYQIFKIQKKIFS